MENTTKPTSAGVCRCCRKRTAEHTHLQLCSECIVEHGVLEALNRSFGRRGPSPRAIARQFLALDPSTLPSARSASDAGDDHCDAWLCLRRLAKGMRLDGRQGFADALRLRADADGWRDGVVIELPADRVKGGA